MIRQRNPGQFGVATEMRIDIEEFYDRLIVPYRPAPVLVAGQIQIMNFSMVPRWSKEAKVKFATHNARLETIDEKPTWKTVFVERHCLVPMSEFIEPIYDGEFAGHMVAFAEASGATIFAAGVWDEWVNRETGEVNHSFAIITHDPPPFVAGVGHDRCPIFLNRDNGAVWLESVRTPSADLKRFLLERNTVPELTAAKQRPMRPGWEKRK
jgi:putative SOS response-associated peptidase YedK